MTQRRRRPPQRRKLRQRRRRLSPGLLLVPLALLILWVILSNHVFVVRNVEVVGAESMDTDAVIRASGIRLGSRLNALDDMVIKSSVDATGRLAFVEAQRRYPFTVRLIVRERSHDAVILQAGKLLVLDSDGYVVSASDTMPEQSLPLVTGLRATTYRLGKQLDASPSRLNAMKAVLEALRDKNAVAYVSELNVDYPSDIQIITRTGMVVLLGDHKDMEKKIVWMTGTLQDLERRGEILGRLDVSSGTKADYLPMVVATPAPAATQDTYLLNTPTSAPTEAPAEVPEEGAVIGEDAI